MKQAISVVTLLLSLVPLTLAHQNGQPFYPPGVPPIKYQQTGYPPDNQRLAPGVPPVKYQQTTQNDNGGGGGQYGAPNFFEGSSEDDDQEVYHTAPGVPPLQYQKQNQGSGSSGQAQHPVVPGVPLAVYQQQPPAGQDHHKGDVGVGNSAEGYDSHEKLGHATFMDTSNITNERDHIQEHMDVPIDTSKMTEKELQFHYFKMHDADKNNMLDGCELIKSLLHWHSHGKGGHGADHSHSDSKPAKIFTDAQLANLIDPILKQDDKNGDGMIDYAEFIIAQEKSEALKKK